MHAPARNTLELQWDRINLKIMLVYSADARCDLGSELDTSDSSHETHTDRLHRCNWTCGRLYVDGAWNVYRNATE